MRLSASFKANDITTQAVERLYEAYPYPNYPLLGKPIWQEGYLTSSKFAAKLTEDLGAGIAAINQPRGQYVRNTRTILVAGAGEVLPYIIRKFEPAAHRLLCVDLSQRSLQRARWRLLGNIRPTEFIRSDINEFLKQQGSVTGPYDHIDAYGVLHHLLNPSDTLRLLAEHLSPGGTMRLMVYNSPARYWIHQLQSVVRLLRLDPYQKRDVRIAKQLFSQLIQESPYLAFKFKCLGAATMANDARLIDTFFHVREVKMSIARWFKAIESSGLHVMGLFDRYGELDELPNPLWQAPSAQVLSDKAATGEFENNLELFLKKPNNSRASASRHYNYERKPDQFDVWPLYLKTPPRLWFSFEETAELSLRTKQLLWVKHFNATNHSGDSLLGRLQTQLPIAALRRLARLGVIFPSQIRDEQLLTAISAPMSGSCDLLCEQFDKSNFTVSPIAAFLERTLCDRGIMTGRRLALIINRLNQAQMSP